SAPPEEPCRTAVAVPEIEERATEKNQGDDGRHQYRVAVELHVLRLHDSIRRGSYRPTCYVKLNTGGQTRGAAHYVVVAMCSKRAGSPLVRCQSLIAACRAAARSL